MQQIWSVLGKAAFVFVFLFNFAAGPAQAQDDSVRGLYKAVLRHEGSAFYQYANITLRTINVGGQLKISANVKVYFGDWDSNEFMTYEYPEVPLNVLTRQVSIRDDANDVSMIGFLRDGQITGEWFSSIVGRVGEFQAQKTGSPEAPRDGVLVRTLSGYYRGTLTNTNPQSNLPPRITMSFVTTQINTPTGPEIKISGNTRLYLGDFDSQEFVELAFNDIQFNYFNRFMTAKTAEYGLTFKGIMTHDGKFDGVVLSDGLGEVGKVLINRLPQ